MRMGALKGTCCVFFAMTMSAVAATGAAAAPTPACMAGQPTAASYTWDFKGEARTIFEGIQADARQAAENADTLASFERGPEVSWQSNEVYLAQLSAAIDDIGTRLCRLEAIRRVVTPGQQREIDLISAEGRLMAMHAQEAFNFGKSHFENLRLDPYRNDVTNLYNEANALTHSLGNGGRAS